jgi:inosine-uridine nucleoside N-ribohydrolase
MNDMKTARQFTQFNAGRRRTAVPDHWELRTGRRLVLSLAGVLALGLAGLRTSAATLGEWNFSEPASTTGTTADSSGNGYHGTLAQFVAPNGLNGSGQALFSGSAAGGSTNRITTAMPLTEAYLGADFKVDVTFTYTGGLLGQWTPLLGSSWGPGYSNSEIFYIGRANSTSAHSLNVNIAGIHQANIANSAFLFDGNPHRLVMTYEKATDTLKFYGDGNATPFATVTGSRSENGNIITTSTLWIGATGHGYSGSNGGELWRGSIDRVLITDTTNGPPPTPSELAQHWPLDGNGANLASTNVGTLEGTVSTVAGQIGQALQFDGNPANRVTAAASPDFRLTNFTLAAWVYLPSPLSGGWQTILEHHRSGDNWYGLWRSSSSTTKFHFRWSSTGTADFLTPLAPDQWQHVAGTYAAGVARLYLNGQLDQTISPAAPPALATGNTQVRIGANLSGGEGFPGRIDDVRIYSVALGDEAIGALAGVTPVSLSITQQPIAIQASSGTMTNLSVGVSGTYPQYQWYKNPATPGDPAAAIPGATGSSLMFHPLMLTNNGNYQVIITNSLSARTSEVVSVTVIADTQPPEIVSALALGPACRVEVIFSKPVSPASAQHPGNYAITNASGAVPVRAASLRTDERTVILTTDAMQDGTNYTLVVGEVRDLAAPPNPANTTRAFTYSSLLVAHYPLDGNASDLGPNGLNGVIQGSPATVAGKFGSALRFNGNPGDFVAVAASPQFRLTNFTLSAWVQFPGALPPPGTQAILEHDRSGSNWYGLWRSGNATNKLSFRWAGGAGSADFNTALVPNRWYHVAGTFANGLATLYLNGIPDWAGILGSAPVLTTNSAFRIGASLGGGEGFNGIIDDVRVYGRALKDADIAALAGLAFLPPALSNGQLTLDWDSAGRLEQASNVAGLWSLAAPRTTKPPQTSAVQPGENRFFRLNARPVPVIFDTDIGDDIDDTWALGLLLKSPELDLKLAIGDQGKTQYRAKLIAKMLERAGRSDVPVGIGIGNAGGVGGQAAWVQDYDLARYPGQILTNGVQAIIDTILQSPEPITLICVGPLPNIAEALRREPRIAERARFIGMHGSVRLGYNGNPPRSAEYNVVANAPACQAAFTAAWPMTITPLDTCGRVQLFGGKYARISSSPDRITADIITNYRLWRGGGGETSSSVLFDTVAVYLAISQDLCGMENLAIRVTSDGYTVIDPQGKPMDVATSWKNLAAFEDWLVDRLAGDR